MKPYDPYLPVHLRKERDELQRQLESRKPKAAPSMDELAALQVVKTVVDRLNPFTDSGREHFEAFKHQCAAKHAERATLTEEKRAELERSDDAGWLKWAQEADAQNRSQYPQWRFLGYEQMIDALKARMALNMAGQGAPQAPATPAPRYELERMREQVPRPPSRPTIPGGDQLTPHFQPNDDDRLRDYRDQLGRLDWYF